MEKEITKEDVLWWLYQHGETMNAKSRHADADLLQVLIMRYNPKNPHPAESARATMGISNSGYKDYKRRHAHDNKK